MKKSNEELLIESSQENRKSFCLLYERTFQKVYSYIYYKTLHREIAEDLTSTTFMKILEKADSFKPDRGSALGWMLKIAGNTVIDHYRKNRGESDVSDVWDLASPEDIENSQIEEESLEQIYDYLHQLPREKRDIIIMRLWQNLSFKEIASMKKMSEAGCKMHFYRALEKMKKELGATAVLVLLISVINSIKGGM